MSEEQWFYVTRGTKIGPVSVGDLAQLTRADEITPDTLVWRSGIQSWQPISRVLESERASPRLFPVQ